MVLMGLILLTGRGGGITPSRVMLYTNPVSEQPAWSWRHLEVLLQVTSEALKVFISGDTLLVLPVGSLYLTLLGVPRELGGELPPYCLVTTSSSSRRPLELTIFSHNLCIMKQSDWMRCDLNESEIWLDHSTDNLSCSHISWTSELIEIWWREEWTATRGFDHKEPKLLSISKT